MPQTPARCPQWGMQMGVEGQAPQQRSRNVLPILLHGADAGDAQAQPQDVGGPKLCNLEPPLPGFCPM